MGRIAVYNNDNKEFTDFPVAFTIAKGDGSLCTTLTALLAKLFTTGFTKLTEDDEKKALNTRLRLLIQNTPIPPSEKEPFDDTMAPETEEESKKERGALESSVADRLQAWYLILGSSNQIHLQIRVTVAEFVTLLGIIQTPALKEYFSNNKITPIMNFGEDKFPNAKRAIGLNNRTAAEGTGDLLPHAAVAIVGQVLSEAKKQGFRNWLGKLQAAATLTPRSRLGLGLLASAGVGALGGAAVMYQKAKRENAKLRSDLERISAALQTNPQEAQDIARKYQAQDTDFFTDEGEEPAFPENETPPESPESESPLSLKTEEPTSPAPFETDVPPPTP